MRNLGLPVVMLAALCSTFAARADSLNSGISRTYSCELITPTATTHVPVPEVLNYPVSVAVQGTGFVELVSTKDGIVSVSLSVLGMTNPDQFDVSTAEPFVVSIAIQGQGSVVFQCAQTQ